MSVWKSEKRDFLSRIFVVTTSVVEKSILKKPIKDGAYDLLLRLTFHFAIHPSGVFAAVDIQMLVELYGFWEGHWIVSIAVLLH